MTQLQVGAQVYGLRWGELGEVVQVRAREFGVAFIVGMGQEEVVWIPLEVLGRTWWAVDVRRPPAQ